MGNQQSIPDDLSVFSKRQWITIANNNLYKIVKCQSQNLIGELYNVKICQYQSQAFLYQYRHDNQKYLVGIHEVRLKKSQAICPSNSCIDVITERIPYRLSDLGQLQLLEAFQMMLSVLHGCKIIYQRCGGFQIDQNMICISIEGKCKIWFNENIAVNQAASLNQYITQLDIFNNVFELFAQRTQELEDTKKYNFDTLQKAIYFVQKNIEKYTIKMKNNKQHISDYQQYYNSLRSSSQLSLHLLQSKRTSELHRQTNNRKLSLKKNKNTTSEKMLLQKNIQIKRQSTTIINKISKIKSEQRLDYYPKNYLMKCKEARCYSTLKTSCAIEQQPQQLINRYKQVVQFPLVRKNKNIKPVIKNYESCKYFFHNIPQIQYYKMSQLNKTLTQTYIATKNQSLTQNHAIFVKKHNLYEEY